MKRIFMSGCGGMLGEAFYEVFKSDNELKCTDIDLNEPWLEYLDFRNFDEYQKSVSEFKADFLFHIGAHTDLEYCEDNIDDTYLTNTISVENAVNIANDLNIPILYISTAGIFDAQRKYMMIGINLILYAIMQEVNMQPRFLLCSMPNIQLY